MQVKINHKPTLQDMTKLHESQYYLWKKSIYVNACRIDHVHFYFICPFCYTAYNKNGQPSKRAKHLIHYHGSSGEYHYRFEDRISHCNSPVFRNFEIAITKKTKHIN